MASSIGKLNPFLYRGYYSDSETGLYYLNSRYYDAQTGRFLNADETSVLQATQGEILGSNLFAYCNNNPVNLKDADGHFGTPMSIALNITVNLVTWAIFKYLVYRDRSWHTRDTIDVISAVVSGVIGWWGSSYLRAKASRFAWGVYVGVKSVIISWSWNGVPKNKWYAANQIYQVIGSSLLTSFF